MKAIAITIRQRGLPERRIVGVFSGTSAAIVAALDLLEAEGATEVGRISTQVLA